MLFNLSALPFVGTKFTQPACYNNIYNMSNKILYIQRGNQLYHKSEGNIIGNRGLHSLGGIKQKKAFISKFAQKKQQTGAGKETAEQRTHKGNQRDRETQRKN